MDGTFRLHGCATIKVALSGKHGYGPFNRLNRYVLCNLPPGLTRSIDGDNVTVHTGFVCNCLYGAQRHISTERPLMPRIGYYKSDKVGFPVVNKKRNLKIKFNDEVRMRELRVWELCEIYSGRLFRITHLFH